MVSCEPVTLQAEHVVPLAVDRRRVRLAAGAGSRGTRAGDAVRELGDADRGDEHDHPRRVEQPADDDQLDDAPKPVPHDERGRPARRQYGNPNVDHEHGEQGGADQPDRADGEVDDARRAVHEHHAHGEHPDRQPADRAVEDELRRDPGGQHGSAVPAPRNTARARSSRSASSAAGPSKRTRPFSMNTARSAIARATLSDCSTMIIVWPAAFSCSTIDEQLLHHHRRQAERQLVDDQHPGSCSSTRASASICCWPPESVAGSSIAPRRQLGEEVEDAVDPRRSTSARSQR